MYCVSCKAAYLPLTAHCGPVQYTYISPEFFPCVDVPLGLGTTELLC